MPIIPARAIDPNDKVGTLGASDPGFVAAAVPLNYVVHYENLATATAPAQVVVVSDPLDASKMDLSTFELGPISFGNITLVPNAGSKTFTGGADLRPEQDVIVAIKATLDPSTGIATWVFTSIDAYAGQLTDDPNAGFLPPNVNSPAGEGSVVFSVMPRNGLATGTAIQNQAQVVFDTNAPIATPTWLNTIDKDAPTSHISALPATVSTPSFNVQWSGTDAGSGVQDYTIYVSDNGGAFTAFQANVTSTSAAFAGVVGHTYGFYSIARDLVGNVESKPPGRGGQYPGKRRAEPADGPLLSTAVRVAEFHRAWRENQSSLDGDHRSEGDVLQARDWQLFEPRRRERYRLQRQRHQYPDMDLWSSCAGNLQYEGTGDHSQCRSGPRRESAGRRRRLCPGSQCVTGGCQ